MAYNVFGNPVTTATLQSMVEYVGKNITRLDRAHVALNLKNAENKDTNARAFVQQLSNQTDSSITTMCLLYNATGDPVSFVEHYDWRGKIGSSPFPVTIANGQWGAFIHVKKNWAPTGSKAAVVYRGKNNAGTDCDWMMSWANPYGTAFYDNKAYTDIRAAGYFDGSRWDTISKLIEAAGISNNTTWNGCYSSATTGRGEVAIFEGIMTLENA